MRLSSVFVMLYCPSRQPSLQDVGICSINALGSSPRSCGVFPGPTVTTQGSGRLPHTCGGVSPPELYTSSSSGSSPHVWGVSCRWIAGILMNCYCISPHPESMSVGHTTTTRITNLGRAKKHVSGLVTSEGVLKYRRKRTAQSAENVRGKIVALPASGCSSSLAGNATLESFICYRISRP